MPLEKSSQRTYFRAELNKLKSNAKAESSRKLILHIYKYLESNPQIKTVGLFAGTNKEPYLLPLLDVLFVQRLAPKFYFPKVINKEHGIMQFEKVTNQQELAPGSFGILEPTSNLTAHKLDLILVPGLAFTKNGARLGQGGGYYDRYLNKYPDSYTLGVGFCCQSTDYLNTQSHDMILDSIVLR